MTPSGGLFNLNTKSDAGPSVALSNERHALQNTTSDHNSIPDSSTKNNPPNENNISYSSRPDFEKQYSEWDGKNSKIRLVVGKTSTALKSIGVKDQNIEWDSSKIIKIKRDHPAMTDDVIVQVPKVVESPIIVMESLTVQGRITMFGELEDANGHPVLVALELNPTTGKGYTLDIIKIASAYGKDTNPQGLIDESEMLYVEPNIEKTRTWLKRFRLQLPTRVKYGFNSRLSDDSASVNTNLRKTDENNTLSEQSNATDKVAKSSSRSEPVTRELVEGDKQTYSLGDTTATMEGRYVTSIDGDNKVAMLKELGEVYDGVYVEANSEEETKLFEDNGAIKGSDGLFCFDISKDDISKFAKALNQKGKDWKLETKLTHGRVYSAKDINALAALITNYIAIRTIFLFNYTHF